MITFKQQKGKNAEAIALDYLESHGLKYVEKNYSCPCGEIDLIMFDKKSLVFIEVRCRRQTGYGSSVETVCSFKQSRIIRSAMHYLQQKNLYDQVDCRFDVIGIDKYNKIVWIKDAFQVQ